MNFIPLSNNNLKKRAVRYSELMEGNKRRHFDKTLMSCDPKLLSRLKLILETQTSSPVLDIDKLTNGLRETYPEYQRRKKNAMKYAVNKAIDILKSDYNCNLPSVNGSDNDKSVISMDVDSDASSGNDTNSSYMDSKSDPRFLKTPKRNTTPVNVSELESIKIRNSSKEFVTPKMFTKTPKSVNKKVNIEDRMSTPVKDHSKKHSRNVSEKHIESIIKEKMKKDSVSLQNSTVTFKDIGGNEKTIQEVCKLLVHMKHPEIYMQLGIVPPRGFLLHGPPGCGKTLLAHAIAGELELPFIKIAATEIISGVSGESEGKIRELFQNAVNSAPCIIFIDEIDAITPKRDTAQKEMERRIVAQLLTCMDELNQRDSMTQVMVIGATNRPDALDPALRRAGRFDREIILGIPDEVSRRSILRVLCKKLRLSEQFDFEVLAKNTPGYVGADLMALTREAAVCAINRIFNKIEKPQLADLGFIDCLPTTSCASLQEKKSKSVLSWLKDEPPLTENELQELFIEMSDFEEALKIVQPSAKREGFATVPDVTWKDIGALKGIQEELQMAILAPINHREHFEAMGLTSPTGILLCGPPGCGKTLLAKAVANESGINFISVKGPELLNMYVGESERAVRQCFQRARNSAPCVIFFDELDALCPRRSDAIESGASSRVVNQLLTEMDGLQSRQQVFVMGATNRPDIIDPAMIRPGRLDKTLFVGLPSADDRVEILRTISKNGTKPEFGDDVNLESLGHDQRCEGFTGADLAALIREACMSAMKEYFTISKSGNAEGATIVVKYQNFESAFTKVKSSVSPKERKIYEKMQISTTVHNSITTKSASKETEMQVVRTDDHLNKSEEDLSTQGKNDRIDDCPKEETSNQENSEP